MPCRYGEMDPEHIAKVREEHKEILQEYGERIVFDVHGQMRESWFYLNEWAAGQWPDEKDSETRADFCAKMHKMLHQMLVELYHDLFPGSYDWGRYNPAIVDTRDRLAEYALKVYLLGRDQAK